VVAIIDVDLSNPDTFVQGIPHEAFATLRREAPVYRHPGGQTGGPFWVVTRYEDVARINKDNILFSSHRNTALIFDPDPETLAQQQLMMLNMDPPMHTRYRLLVNKGFTPRMVGQLEANARVLTNQILDEVIERGECDFVTDIAAELPLQIICELLGVPQEDRHQIFDWSNRLIGSEDPEYEGSVETAFEASAELYAYFNRLAAERRVDPRADLVSVLNVAEVDGDTLSELELDLFFLLLSVAGNETTRNLIAHGMLALMEHPDQRAKLLANPDLLSGAVEEMLRWGTPVMQFRRTATEPTMIRDQPIAEGDKVVIYYMSANRDETVFEDPYTFDITRSPNEHVAFGGGGPHFCLGANLARLEIRVMFEEILRRMPEMEMTGPAQRLRSNFINGIKHLPVAFPAGQRVAPSDPLS
jgi:cholest-4-en-3-one 26-monooxygenase